MRIIKSVLILFLLSISFHTYAQLGSLIKSIDEFDLIVGPSLVHLRGGEWVEKGRQLKIGYSFGVGFRYNLTTRFSLGPKILFERKGMEQKLDVTYQDDNVEKIGQVVFKYDFNYLTIPILARYHINKKNRFYIEGGVFTGFLIKEKTTAEILYRNTTQVSNGTDDFEKIDLGLSAGIGGTFPLTENLSLSISIFNNTGLLDVSKLDPSMFTFDPVKTNSTCLMISLVF